jgi:HEAT repeat protein
VTIRLGPLLLVMIALVATVIGIQSAMEEQGGNDGNRSAASSPTSPTSVVTPKLLAEQRPQSSKVVVQEPLSSLEAADPSALLPTDVVARLIAQTASSDAQSRADAISALAKAPKAEAIPVLRNVLNNGEPIIDRSLALQALRDLALYQGDDDGVIRSVVREAIYHGDDEAVALSAQGALEIIEESEMR